MLIQHKQSFNPNAGLDRLVKATIRLALLIIILALILFLNACASSKPATQSPPPPTQISQTLPALETFPLELPKPVPSSKFYVVKGKKYYILESAVGFHEEGLAAWYGKAHHGRKTASGERFNQHKLTAAHPTLPMGTMVEVTNPANGKKVIVRINDRGPFSDGHVIDLSKAAAQAIGLKTTSPVKVRVPAK